MMQYSRNGIYIKRAKKQRKTSGQEKQSVDIVNILLFALLGVVVVLFIVT